MIVCEIGLNHLGNKDYFDYYIEKLNISKCDAITYQIREPEFYLKKKYKNYIISMDYYQSLKSKTNKKIGVALADTDLISDFEKIGADFYKVLSWDLTNYNYVDKLLSLTNKSLYISTGTSDVNTLDNFFKRYGVNKRINFIHTQLTQNPSDANLSSISFLRNRYNYSVGFGNHSDNLNVILASITFRPSDIWFYVKGADYSWRFHPDEFWAVQLDEVDSMIDNINDIKSAIGDGKKTSINSKGY